VGTDQILLLILAIILVALVFYASAALVGRDWSADGSHILKLLLVSVIAVIVLPILRDITSEADFGDLGLLFAFIILIVVIRYVLVEDLPVSDDWAASIVVAFLGVILLYVLDEVARRYFDVGMLSIF